jgi:hypothetical protein
MVLSSMLQYNLSMARNWNLKTNDPLILTLAVDARLGQSEYLDDQIWEFRSAGGEPNALALQTTFGLRARNYRLFPRFRDGDQEPVDREAFHSAPVVTRYYPNYLSVTCQPFLGIDVELEYWVPHSQGVCGRINLFNGGKSTRKIQVDWVAQLSPTEGQRMAPHEIQAAQVLLGLTEDIYPLLFMTGGPQAASSPFPALFRTTTLEPGERNTICWAQAAKKSPDLSLYLARELVERPWEAEIARIELLNASQVEITTGNPEWNAALARSQTTALSLLVGPTSHLPSISFVLNRTPDQGYTRRGDGSDYNYFWSGQPAWDAAYLASFLMPGYPGLVQGMIKNYLAAKNEDGDLDWKPGLAGQRSLLMATPVLCDLTMRVYEINPDIHFLQDVFPGLLAWIQEWFSVRHDHDEDGVPEWSHPMQIGLEEHRLFSRWYEGSSGVEISCTENPGLAALLLCEINALIRMAEILERSQAIPPLQSLKEHLKLAIDNTWDDERVVYSYIDRDSHIATTGRVLAIRKGSGDVVIGGKFVEPVRLLVRVISEPGAIPRPRLIVHGEGKSGQHRIEHVSDERFKWYLGQGILTGERVYRQLEHIEVQGLREEDHIEIQAIDFRTQDISLFLPLWAGLAPAGIAKTIVEQHILNPERYLTPYGLATYPPGGREGVEDNNPQMSGSDLSSSLSDQKQAIKHSLVQMSWNSLIGEGLLRYGYRNEAAELFKSCMRAIIYNLRQHGAFFNGYNGQTGEGLGERNTLGGLAPVKWFLEILGVRIYSAEKVMISGINPFPWTVTVQYRGMTIQRRKTSAIITFADGRSATVKGAKTQVIHLRAA